MQSKDLVEQVLNVDMIQRKEDKLKKRHEDFSQKEQTETLLDFVKFNKIKENILKNAKDTYMAMPWSEFINLIEAEGFEKQSQWDYTSFNDKSTATIYTKGGMILFATSTGKQEHVNSGHLYIQAQLKEGLSSSDIKSFQSGGYFDCKNNKLEMSYDIREGLINHIREVEEKCNILPIFEHKQSLWFSTYEDEKRIGEKWKQYDEVNEKRILEAGEKVKTICSVMIDEPFVLKSGMYKDTDLTCVVIEGNVLEIEPGAFEDCPKLKEIIIKSDVLVQPDVFINCPNLQKVIVQGIEIEVKSGNIKDNSLTGLIEAFRNEKDSEKAIKEATNKLNKLSYLLEKCAEDNKNDMINLLEELKKQISQGGEFVGLRIDGFVNMGTSFVDNKVWIYKYNGSNNIDSSINPDNIIDEAIEKIKNGEINKINVKLQNTSYEDYEIQNEQYKLIKKGIDSLKQSIQLNEDMEPEAR